jgi:hypothetical protein
MIEFDVDSHKFTKVIGMLSHIIGPQLYWIHNKVGGAGWTISRKGGKCTIVLEDDALASFVILNLT